MFFIEHSLSIYLFFCTVYCVLWGRQQLAADRQQMNCKNCHFFPLLQPLVNICVSSFLLCVYRPRRRVRLPSMIQYPCISIGSLAFLHIAADQVWLRRCARCTRGKVIIFTQGPKQLINCYLLIPSLAQHVTSENLDLVNGYFPDAR